MDTTVTIRPALPADVKAYVSIETDAYFPEFAESGKTFLSKLNAFPAGCKIAELEGKPVGYLLSHPWTLNDPPALDCEPFLIPKSPDSFFIHSLTLSKNAHGKGIGTKLAQTALQLASEFGYSNIALISVQGSHQFWEKFGFKTIENLPLSAAKKLAGYGPSARFMVR
jgi:predicted N-acetyltransferase YhbS